MVRELRASEFLELRGGGKQILLLDVREDWEIELAPAPCEHAHIPMGQIAGRLSELDPAVETVVLCHAGGRSRQVARYLENQGFKSVCNLSGGISAWSREVDKSIPEY